MNTHDHHDDDPMPSEDELKALYRNLPRKEPSPALDQTVRGMAAAAARASRPRRLPHWPVAVASAAVLVIVAGLSWRMYQQPSSLPQVQGTTAMTISPSPSPAEAPTTAASTHAPAEAVDAIAQQAPTALAASGLPKARESVRSALKPRVVAPVLTPRQSPQPLAEAPLAMAPAAPAPPAPPAPSAPVAAVPADQASPPSLAQQPIAGLATYSHRNTMAMKAAAAPMPAPMAALDQTAANPADTPAQELDKIRQLFAQQRRDEALKRLATFRQSHPDMPLPDDLRAQLPDHE
ncbi:hypothetical protein [Dyella sp. 20L07]|uniref:hypothetical protein n=1 Tax=Dyella sp. 20L07 TaxID=3384240 RepID=UPI003D2AA807